MADAPEEPGNDRGFVVDLMAGERTYEEGSADGYRRGIKTTLDALEGHEGVGGTYGGPMPRQLKAWIKDVRARLAAS